jgi:large subunit ribosomal protein L2
MGTLTLTKLFTNLSITRQVIGKTPLTAATNQQFVRNFIYNEKRKHKHGVGGGNQFRRTVHFPEDGKYTVRPLDNTHLAGRDPETGRVVANGIGGGVKHK